MDIYDPSGDVEIDTTLFLTEGESFILEATEGFSEYLWQPAEGLNNASERSVTLAPANGAYYMVTGTTAEGCTDADTIHVVIASKLEIFTGFTPNGDEFNETWVIRHAVEYGDKISVQVFNRWGEKVFESKGYGGENEWDGTRNGKPLPVGAYYYIIEIGVGESRTYTGTVTIIR
jgi:gliding motility-associated-like protein